jgi:hypothetical protein
MWLFCEGFAPDLDVSQSELDLGNGREIAEHPVGEERNLQGLGIVAHGRLYLV